MSPTNHECAIAALNAIHRALHDLLDDENLDTEKLERASESLLPNCADWAAYGIPEGTRSLLVCGVGSLISTGRAFRTWSIFGAARPMTFGALHRTEP